MGAIYQRDDKGNIVIDLAEPMNLAVELGKSEFKKFIKSAKWQERQKGDALYDALPVYE